MEGIDEIKAAVKSLRPPKEGDTKDRERWQNNITAAVVVLLVVGAAHMAWGAGWLKYAGLGGVFNGPAMAATVDDRLNAIDDKTDSMQRQITDMKHTMASDTDDIKALVVSGQIITMKANECDAQRNKNTPLAQSLNNQLSDLESKYEVYSHGSQYPVEPCP